MEKIFFTLLIATVITTSSLGANAILSSGYHTSEVIIDLENVNLEAQQLNLRIDKKAKLSVAEELQNELGEQKKFYYFTKK